MLRGNVTIGDLDAAVLFSLREIEAALVLHADSVVSTTVVQYHAEFPDDLHRGAVMQDGHETEAKEFRDVEMRLAPFGPMGVTVWSADAIQVRSGSADLLGVWTPGVARPDDPSASPDWLVRGPEEPAGAMVVAQGQGTRTLMLDGSMDFEVHGWTGSLQHSHGQEDISAGRATVVDGPDMFVDEVHFQRFKVRGGSLSIALGAANWLGHGDHWSASVDGIAALLGLNATSGLHVGSPTPNGTWLIEGHSKIENLRPAGPYRMRGELYADPEALLIDGQAVPLFRQTPMQIATGVTLVAVALGVAAKLYGLGTAALFTRLTPEKALEHERRRQLYEYIKAKPGPNFRELVRETGIPAGTCRHHLNVLQRSDLIVEKEHGAAVRFFQNHGRFDRDWEVIAVLRNPDLKRVHSWLKSNPGVMQKEYLEHAEKRWKWSRSTAQHRLKRLQDSGLLDVTEFGRSKHYEARDTVCRDEKPFHPLTWKG